LQPNIIVNNRVGKERPGMEGLSDKPFVVGDYGTPEQQIPARGFGPGVDWESCMTMNDTWGFDKRDNHWKSATTMIRMLADCASKGGNLLMNVGPTGEGLIPAASVERLAEVGKWMEVNHEAIYDTTASPFKKLAFGKCTQKPGKLFLHVFDWPADGKLVVPISSKVKRAYLMGSRSKSFHVTAGATGAQIELPTTAPDAADSVIVLEIRGEPSVLEVGLTQAADGTIKLLAEDAEIQGSGLRLENRGGRPNVGYWGSASDYVQWPVQVNQPGTFRVEVTYACEPGSAGSEYSVVAGGSKVTGKVEATRDWDTFTAAQPGQIRLNQGKAIICVKPAGTKINGAGLMNLRSVVLRRENE
jgi:alpha-L-fucosidase